jgi:PTS system nitrogen regulatory IIA component
MFPPDFFNIESIRLSLEASSKKRVLEELALLLETDEHPKASIYDQLQKRERIGSTGMGHGIALPHARIPGLTQARGGFIRLASGVDYSAIDDEPVDMIFGLLVPEQATREHLQLLASLAAIFRQAAIRDQLRILDDPRLVYQLLAKPQTLP